MQKRKPFPKIKQNLKDFISDESGIVTKEQIMKAGLLIGSVLAVSNLAAAHGSMADPMHTNGISLEHNDANDYGEVTAKHNHHAQHMDVH